MQGDTGRREFLRGVAGLWLAAPLAAQAEESRGGMRGHPRLYFTAADLPRLRDLRRAGVHQQIWKNVEESAEWCLARTPRRAWIAPMSPDPRYENLYDRFYAIMGDLAVTEHLGLAYALSGEERYGEAARRWVLASCRAWRREAEGAPDGSKAYAVARLLKGLAVGYDVVHDRFSESERTEIRDTLVKIGQKYYSGYFRTPTISGPGFHTHHAIVEWGSFGVAALALLGEAAEADAWLGATTTKFEQHLLPAGLAEDGAQTEGGTFWASTMHYRLFFMDALRRVTGRDLFRRHEKYMSADLALASIAAEKGPGYDDDHGNVVLEPSYGQLDYYAPALLLLAREYRRPIYQYLALWDRSLGQIQKTRYTTPHGEQLLFELGGYAYLWYDPTVPATAGEEKLSYRFPSVDEAYLRASWRPNDLVVGVRKGSVIVHAGGQAVLVELRAGSGPADDLAVASLTDDGSRAAIVCGRGGERWVKIDLDRRGRRVTIGRRVAGDWQWWCHRRPVRRENALTFGERVRLTLKSGSILALEPAGYTPRLAVGNGVLPLADPSPRAYPLVTVGPTTDGEALVEVQLGDGSS